MPTEPAAQSSQPSPSLWRQRNFLLLWGGQGISVIGSMLSGIARPFLIFQLGGGARAVGVALALAALPFALLALPAGAWVDRWDRKRTMVFSDLGRGLAIGSVVIALAIGKVSVPLIYVTAFAEGICSVFFSLAETASLPQVVDKEHLSDALNYNQALFSLAFLVGPPLGGFFFTITPSLPFSLDALSFLVSMCSLAFISVPFQQSQPTTSPHLLREIRDGVAWLWHEPESRFLTLINGLISVALGGSALVIIRLVIDVLPRAALPAAPTYTGTILACGGAGGILGTIICARLLRRFSLPLLICGALWLQGVLLVLLTLAPNFAVLAILFVSSYALWPTFNASLNGYRLPLIPDHLRGRVNSIFQLVSYVASPLGAVMIGVLVAKAGIAVTVASRGVLLLVIALLTTGTFLRWRTQRARVRLARGNTP